MPCREGGRAGSRRFNLDTQTRLGRGPGAPACSPSTGRSLRHGLQPPAGPLTHAVLRGRAGKLTWSEGASPGRPPPATHVIPEGRFLTPSWRQPHPPCKSRRRHPAREQQERGGGCSVVTPCCLPPPTLPMSPAVYYVRYLLCRPRHKLLKQVFLIKRDGMGREVGLAREEGYHPKGD